MPDVFDVVCDVCLANNSVTGGLQKRALAAMCEKRLGLERRR